MSFLKSVGEIGTFGIGVVVSDSFSATSAISFLILLVWAGVQTRWMVELDAAVI